METAPLPRRPGATRSEGARAAILKATAELIATEGYDHLTIGGIAARARVGKPTIYRWWSSKSELIAECLVDNALLPDVFVLKSTGDVVEDITDWLREVFRFTRVERNAGLIRSLIAAAADNREVAEQLNHRLGAHPDSLDGRLEEAVRLGELDPETPIVAVREALIGMIILRVIGGIPVEDADATTFAKMVLMGSLASRATCGRNENLRG